MNNDENARGTADVIAPYPTSPNEETHHEAPPAQGAPPVQPIHPPLPSEPIHPPVPETPVRPEAPAAPGAPPAQPG